MPELPDITAYVEALERRIVGERLEGVRVNNPFLARTFEPPLEAANGKTVRKLRRLGKRIAIGLDDELWLVLHLMIAGRLHWKPCGAKLAGKFHLAALDFPEGSLLVTEAGTKRRASLHLLCGDAALREQDPGGLEVLSTPLAKFQTTLRQRNHTIKRALTDPHLFSGIGNAYSDEILHRAQLSPLALTQRLSEDDIRRLFDATQLVLREWIDRLRLEAGDDFPKKVTAFRPQVAVHGRYGELCPSAPHPCSGSATPTTRPTTAPVARPRAASSRIGRSRACSRMTGRETWTSWKAIESWFALLVRSCRAAILLPAFGQRRTDLALQDNRYDFRDSLTFQPRQIWLERLALGDHVAPGNLAASIGGRAAENGGQVWAHRRHDGRVVVPAAGDGVVKIVDVALARGLRLPPANTCSLTRCSARLHPEIPRSYSICRRPCAAVD